MAKTYPRPGYLGLDGLNDHLCHSKMTQAKDFKHGIQVDVEHGWSWPGQESTFHNLSAGRTRAMVKWCLARISEQRDVPANLVASDVRTYRGSTQVSLLYR